MSKTEAEIILDTVRPLLGLYVGQLSNYELEVFNQACKAGIARRAYVGPGAVFGLATVALVQNAGEA